MENMQLIMLPNLKAWQPWQYMHIMLRLAFCCRQTAGGIKRHQQHQLRKNRKPPWIVSGKGMAPSSKYFRGIFILFFSFLHRLFIRHESCISETQRTESTSLLWSEQPAAIFCSQAPPLSPLPPPSIASLLGRDFSFPSVGAMHDSGRLKVGVRLSDYHRLTNVGEDSLVLLR